LNRKGESAVATGTKTLRERVEWSYNVLNAFHPQTVRQIYYIAISEGWLPPDNARTKRRAYMTIQRALEKGRREGEIPWDWIVDVGRVYERNFSEKSLKNFAEDAPYYYVPIANHGALLWVEKDTIVPTIQDIAYDFVCPLVSGRGFSGLSHIRRVALDLEMDVNKVFFIGDHDPSGLSIDESLEDSLRDDFGVYWAVTRIAVTWEQAQDLPHLELKPTDSRTPGYYARYGPRAWEVEALPVQRLRSIVYDHLREIWSEGDRERYMQTRDQERDMIAEAMSELR
jgi:hypothetical protein